MRHDAVNPARSARPIPWPSFIVGALSGALWVAVHQAPARWLTPMVQRISDGRVHLIDARGTLWQGSAYLGLGNGSERPEAMAWSHRLHWHLSAQSLTSWQLRLRPEPQPEAMAWTWGMRWHPAGWQLSLSDIDWHLPTAWLSGLGAPWNTVQPDGMMRLRSRGWQWQKGRPEPASGEVTLTLERFATRLSSIKPLGDYQLRIYSNNTLKVDLSTIQGHLRMSGQGRWDNGRLQFQGEAWADQAQDETALSNLLQILGPRVGPRTLLKVG